MFGPADGEGTTDALAEGATLGAVVGTALGAVVAAAGVAGAPKLQIGAAVVVQAATPAATPVRPAAPATRRKPRRLRALAAPFCSGSAGDAASGWVRTVGSTGRDTPMLGAEAIGSCCRSRANPAK
jgi:hypothetical protein